MPYLIPFDSSFECSPACTCLRACLCVRVRLLVSVQVSCPRKATNSSMLDRQVHFHQEIHVHVLAAQSLKAARVHACSTCRAWSHERPHSHRASRCRCRGWGNVRGGWRGRAEATERRPFRLVRSLLCSCWWCDAQAHRLSNVLHACPH